MKKLLRRVWDAGGSFLKRAGTVILASIWGCHYMSAIDATAYFNQWHVHPES